MRLKSILFVFFLFFGSTASAAEGARPTHWKTGLIGGGIGGAVVGTFMGAVFEGVTNLCPGEDYSCGSSAKSIAAGIGIGLGIAAAGAGIGALIGAAIPKKEKQITLNPYVAPDGHSGGAMVSGAF